MAKDWKVWEDGFSKATVYKNPVLQGTLLVSLKQQENATLDFMRLMEAGKTVSNILKTKLNVPRCALVMDSKALLCPYSLLIIPMLGVSSEWAPVLAKDKEFQCGHPGYITSRDGDKMPDEQLDKVKALMVEGDKLAPNYTFLGPSTDTSLFARIVRGELPQWRVWEGEHSVAFLTPFPSTEGFTVVVPRSHLSSDILGLEDEDFKQLMEDSREVGLKLQERLGAEGFGVICEGMEIDYAHVKLVPLYKSSSVGDLVKVGPRLAKYPGFVTSQQGPDLTEEEMETIWKSLV